MTDAHPLDRPVWSALTSYWKPLSLGGDRARRLHPDYGPFAAMADASPASLAALTELAPTDGGPLVMLEAEAPPIPPGLEIVLSAEGHQMLAEAVPPGDPGFRFTALTEADAPEMLALARLTEPGPFSTRTHQLSAFIGVKVDGRLAAMAGERMRAPGYSEISGVCTHPDFRGRGYAAELSRVVAHRILARGETPFLHVYAHNAPAIAIYAALGFRLRREMAVTMLARPGASGEPIPGHSPALTRR